jgi:hypothetical protein
VKAKPVDPLDAYSFGRALLAADDLDPVYVVLHHAEWEDDAEDRQLERWLLAYWCFYHVGTASWVADVTDDEYWDRFRTAAGSKEYPRSSERRHFRGGQALRSTEYLAGRGVFDLFSELLTDPERGDSPAARSVTAASVIATVRGWRGFGPWVAFKVADMLERIGLLAVTFDVGTAMYEGSPTEATRVLAEWENLSWRKTGSQSDLSVWAVDRAVTELSEFTAPPRHERPLGPQEAETVLCKWKSYLNGHYHVGEDVAAVRRALAWADGCPTARRLEAAARKGGLW